MMRLLLLLTVLVSCTSLAYGRGKKKMYGNYKTFYLPENCHAECSEENAKDVEPVQTDFKKLESFICSHNVEDMMDSEVCICFQDSDSSWVKRCGDCNVQVKIYYKPEGYEPASYSGTGTNSGSAAALEDEATLKAIEETADLNPTSTQESEASNASSGEDSNDDDEIPNKTKKTNKAKVKAIKKKAVKTKAPKKKAAIKKPSIKALSKRKAKKKKPVNKSKKKRRFSNKKADDTSKDIPNRPDVGEIQDSWNDIPNSFQVEEASADTEAPNKSKRHRGMKKRRKNKRHSNQEDLFAADAILDLYAEE